MTSPDQRNLPGDATLILQAMSRSEPLASEKLLPLVYDELRRLAAARMASEAAGHTLQPTALVHEAWLRLVSETDRNWENRAHFFRAAAQAMRRILIDRARQKASLKRGGGRERLDIEELDLAAASPDDRLLLIDEGLQQLEREDPESAQIILLKFFTGLTNKEAARTLGISESTVERRWAFAKVCLFEMIREAEAAMAGNG
jgi:RNA polymerase sigma factor (TIGR02999 family)